ncbi:hypothetical protein LMG27174_01769 [Paraburkholderia rhynchosiae]|uniref:Uncharacterized protein n=1 Tax=Paraburkholderia rhynchosiae TaxID=487049 RepID=A0A6J5ACI3_9BURK|nr:hypothetical protein LMG27174_01769 [Paraburkholderia rhynchosiae]
MACLGETDGANRYVLPVGAVRWRCAAGVVATFAVTFFNNEVRERGGELLNKRMDERADKRVNKRVNKRRQPGSGEISPLCPAWRRPLAPSRSLPDRPDSSA